MKLANRGLVAVSLSTLIACGGEGTDEATGVEEDGLLRCGFQELFSEDHQLEEIVYASKALTHEIADKGLIAQLGFERVSTCDEAARATAAIQEFEAAQPELDNFVTGDLVDDLLQTEAGEKIANAIGEGFLPGLELQIGPADNAAFCTGALINPRVAVTAAHCVTHLVTPNGTDRTAINQRVALNIYTPPGPGAFGSWRCSHTGELFTKCTTTMFAHISIKAEYTGTGDSDDDIAVVWLGAGQFNSVATSDLLRVYVGSFNNFSGFHIHGRGPSSDNGSGVGVMRYASFGLDSFGSYKYVSNVRTPRTCSGDSGGYATVNNCLAANPSSCGNHLIGLHVKSTHGGITDQCANTGGTQTGVRMAGGAEFKIDWIEEMTGIACSNPLQGTVGPYVRCW